MTEELMDITPSVNFLKSLRGERIDYTLLIGEAIDNALDAGADTVAIKVDPEFIMIADDGQGVTKGRIKKLFSLGEHGAMTTTSLGRFGIGIKSQAVNAGDEFYIDSTSLEGRVIAQVNWRNVLAGGRWVMQMPRWLPIAVGSPSGTTVKVSALRKVPEIKFERIRQKIADWFHPAIIGGKRIVFNGQQVVASIDPEITDVIDRTLILSDDRSAHLRAGIMKEPSKSGGVHIAYRHRVLKHGTSTGTKTYGGIRLLFARVVLDGSWRLAKFKDDLADETEFDELDDAIFDAIEPILKKISESTFDARLDEIGKKINALLPEEIAARPHSKKDKAAKAKDDKRDSKQGKVDSDKSDPASTGPAKTKKRNDTLLVTWDGDAEEDGIGRFRKGSPHRVDLSPKDPFIAALIEIRDSDLGAKLLLEQAIILYLAWKQETSPELPFESFGRQISNLLAKQDAEIPRRKGASS